LAGISVTCAHARPQSRGEVNQKIDSLVDKIVLGFEKIESAQYRNTIAVLDFENQSKDAVDKNIGAGASELLVTRLSETGKFRIVERKRLSRLIDEIALGQTGMVSEETAVQAGKIVGADIIVLGSVSELGGYFNLNVRLIEVDTGTILISTAEEIEKGLLVSSTSFISPARYRIGASGTLHAPDADWGRSGGWVSLLYSRELGRKSSVDLQAGYGPELQLTDSVSNWAEVSSSPWAYDGQASTTSGVFAFEVLLNRSLKDSRNVRVSCFTGLTLLKARCYIYPDGYVYTGMGTSLPLGLNIHLYRTQMVSFRLSMGYLFTLSDMVLEYPDYMVKEPAAIRFSPKGVISSAGILMYF